MITPQPPLNQPIIPTTMPVLQEQADAYFNGSNLQDRVKELVLKYLIGARVDQNEQHQILTDVTVQDMATGRTIVGHNEDTEHFAASVNKVPVALLVLEDLRAGKLQLNQMMHWQPSDVRAGEGRLDQPGAPLQATLGEVLYDMLHDSGNTAVRISVNKALGGSGAVNARWQAKQGLPHTYLIPVDADRFYLGNTTSRDALWALKELLKTPDAHSDFMKNALVTNVFTDFGVRSQLEGNDYIVLANKVGFLDDVEGNNRHDVGIIYNTRTHKTYGYSFLTTAPYDETDYSLTQEANQSLKTMGAYTLRFAGDRKQREHGSGQRSLQQERVLQPEKRVLY